MRILIGLLAIATLALGQSANTQTANPQRFIATDVRLDGDITHLRGSVLLKTQSAIIHAEDADFNARQYSITIRGDSQWNILPVHYLDPNDPAAHLTVRYISWKNPEIKPADGNEDKALEVLSVSSGSHRS